MDTDEQSTQPLSSPPAPDPPSGAVSPGNPLRLVAALLAALVLGVFIGPILVSGLNRITPVALWNRITGRTNTFDVSSPAVVERIRQLSRLETVVYSLDKIVEGNRDNPYIPSYLVGDKILLVAHGEVIAGIDFSQLKPSDIHVSGEAVEVHLPPAQILTTRIDNGRTRVFSRTTGLFVLADPNLESQTRAAAEQQIGQAALDDGILDKARQNARASVTALLYSLGFHKVDVE
jgi:hypothetical protein